MKTTEWDAPGAFGRPGAEHENIEPAGNGGLDHALALELVPVTEAAAIAASRWVGRGDESSGKADAVDAMHTLIRSVPMRGVVVIGEDGKRLVNGEDAGSGDGPARDVAISAGDGVLSAAKDVPNALAVIAVAERGVLYVPAPGHSMDKLAVGPGCAGVVDLDRPAAENLRAIAAAKRIDIRDVVVAVLNRPWHRKLVDEIRGAGARVHLIEGGEIAGAIATARPESAVDVLLGTGGAAEGVLAAAALSCLGGSLQARLRPEGAGRSATGDVLHTGDLVRGGSILFCATGITGNEVLRGVRHRPGRVTTHSIVLSSNPDAVRIVRSEHRVRTGSAGSHDG